MNGPLLLLPQVSRFVDKLSKRATTLKNYGKIFKNYSYNFFFANSWSFQLRVRRLPGGKLGKNRAKKIIMKYGCTFLGEK